jgi:hypothetical protein
MTSGGRMEFLRGTALVRAKSVLGGLHNEYSV